MKGRVERLTGAGWVCSVFVPEQEAKVCLPVLILNLSSSEEMEPLLPEIKRGMGKTMRPACLAVVENTDWGRDFSPWPAPSLREGEPPFPGGARERLRLLTREILPRLRETYSVAEAPEDVGVLGYSLGALAALWMLYECADFGMAGCLSGSLWYDGFMDYCEKKRPANSRARVFLSLGRKEEKTRHPLFSRIGDCYRREASLLREQLGEENTTFVWYDGGHGTEVNRRMTDGIHWLLKRPEAPEL